MKQYKTIITSFLLVGFLYAGAGYAQNTTPINITTTAVPALRISSDARGGGMGNTGIATSAGANAGFYNLAKTPFAEDRSGIAINYAPWMKDVADGMYFMSVAGFHRIDTMQAISASVRYFNLGNIAVTDHNNNLQQMTHPNELIADIGYSRRLSERFSLGVALRYISSRLMDNGMVGGTDYKGGQSVAGDISAFYNGQDMDGQGFSAGLTLSNLGSKIYYTTDKKTGEFIPANLGVGLAYTTVLNPENRLTLGIDLNKLLVPAVPEGTDGLNEYYQYGVMESWGKSFGNDAQSVSIGAEYGYNDRFFARGGYYRESKQQGSLNYVSAGLGVNYEAFGFNFAYIIPSGDGVDRNPLSNTLRFSLLFRVK